MNTLRLMLRMLLRDLRAGELTVLALALVLAVAALTSVGFLSDRVGRSVVREAHQLLGGDLLLTADHPWPDRYRDAVRQRGLRLAESAGFLSMVGNATQNDGVLLAEIKAVSDGYPLRGVLRVAPQLNSRDDETAVVPSPGTVWPDERLATSLRLDRDDHLHVGMLQPAVTAIVTLDPERGVNPFAFAPRLIVNLADLPATGLVQTGSRISWRLHVAGDASVVAEFRRWALAHLGRGEKLEDLDNARPEIRNIVERAERFLRLAALLTAVLAAVAVGLSARRYMQRHLDACAVMRCLGASEGQILLIHGGEFIILGLLAATLGGGLGYLIQEVFRLLLSGLVSADLPPAGALPWLHGFAVGSVLVAGFVLPPLLRLKSVPTVRVLRREWGRSEPLSLFSYLVGLLCLAGLMLWMADNVRLGAVVLGGFVLAVAVFALAARSLLVLTGYLSVGWMRGGGRIGIANLRRRSTATLVQIVALALGLTTLAILMLVKNDLLATWKTRIPLDAPNRFLINIQPDQRDAITDFFIQRSVPAPRLEPMVRGRLTHLNRRKIGPDDFSDDRAQRLVEREFNLSARDDLPTGNGLLAGRWHEAGSGVQFSVEKGLAETLDLHVGDELTFEIAGQPLAARITSLRTLDWDSMRVNFFVIAPAGTLDGYPTSYIAGFYLPHGQETFVNELVRQFPNLTVVDVAALLRQLQAMLDQVARALQLVFGFALFAGVAVLYAALQATAGERTHELAVLRALGGRQRQLQQALLAEYAMLGAIAGLLAAVGAAAIGHGLAFWVFQWPYLPSPWLFFAGPATGACGIAAAGWLATRSELRFPVVEGLRHG